MVESFSDSLKEKLAQLRPKQRAAIVRLVTGELSGISRNRLLKTAYSCPGCGWQAGWSGQSRAVRHAALAEHRQECSGYEWDFATTGTSWQRWRTEPEFLETWQQAQIEAVEVAISSASRQLQAATIEAVEVLRQILRDETAEARDRRMAAVAILDRADISTANKIDDSLSRWLRELRSSDE